MITPAALPASGESITTILMPLTAAAATGTASAGCVDVRDAPVAAGLPTITGSPIVGNSLTTDNGVFSNCASSGPEKCTYTYQWSLYFSTGSVTPPDTSSDTTASLGLIEADAAGGGVYAYVTVTATNAVGQASETTAHGNCDTDCVYGPVINPVPQVLPGTANEAKITCTGDTDTGASCSIVTSGNWKQGVYAPDTSRYKYAWGEWTANGDYRTSSPTSSATFTFDPGYRYLGVTVYAWNGYGGGLGVSEAGSCSWDLLGQWGSC